jgi:hypothetical protein
MSLDENPWNCEEWNVVIARLPFRVADDSQRVHAREK